MSYLSLTYCRGILVLFKWQDIVHEYPYHIDSLIQLSEIFRMNEDAQTAVDLLGEFTDRVSTGWLQLLSQLLLPGMCHK